MSVITAVGYWQEWPEETREVLICTGSWDGGDNDDLIFFYMDGAPLKEGGVIGNNFVISKILCVEEV